MPSDDHYWQTARRVCTDLQYQTLELSRLHGLSLQQIAVGTDRSVSTIRSTLKRAEQLVEIELRRRYFTKPEPAA